VASVERSKPERSDTVFVTAFGNKMLHTAFVATRRPIMLHYALVFFVIAIIAAVFGFGGIAAGAAEIAKILFFIFLVVFIVTLIMGLMRR
jgi:uncharacterized membrane protein YtjA (UPF0391 family)